MYKSVVIGLGRVGQGYDYNCPDNSVVQTHAAGYSLHREYCLVGGSDTSSEQRHRFEKKFRCKAYSNIDDLMKEAEPDIVSIAVPTDQHVKVVQQVATFSPKAIICEKPVGLDLNETLAIVNATKSRGIALLPNYMRRFDEGTQWIKKVIRTSELGEFYVGNVWYTRGLINNCSHMVDLAISLFGHLEVGTITKVTPSSMIGDVEPDFSLTSDSLEIYFHAAESDYYELFELDLVGSLGRIRYLDAGQSITYQKKIEHPIRANHFVLSEELTVPTSFSKYQLCVLENLYQHLRFNKHLSSNSTTVVETKRVIQNILSALEKHAGV